MKDDGIELAKSWFELTKILTVLAGLFFVLASLHASSYSSLRYNLDLPMKACQFSLNNDFETVLGINLSYEDCVSLIEIQILDEIEKNQKITYTLVFLGFLSILNSFFFWIVGRLKLSKNEIRLWQIVSLWICLNFFLIFLFYLSVFGSYIISKQIQIGNKTIDLCDYGYC